MAVFSPGFGRGTGFGLAVSLGSFSLAFVGSLPWLFWKIMRHVMLSDNLGFGRVVVMRHGIGLGLALSVFLLLLFIEAISFGYVVKIEDMLGSFGREVLVLDENASGVWSSLVLREPRHKFGIPLDVGLRLLLRDEAAVNLGFFGVERTHDTGNDIHVHGVSSHGKEFTFRFWPFPALWPHALSSESLVASHSSSSLHEPVTVGSGRQQAGYTRLAPWESWFFDSNPVDSFFIRSAFFNVDRPLLGPVMTYPPESVNFDLDFLSVLVRFPKFDSFLAAEWDPEWVIVILWWVKDRFDIHISFGVGKLDWGVGPSPSDEVDSEPGLGGAIMLGVEDTIVKGVSLFPQLGGESVPEFPSMGDFGLGDVFENEIVWL